MALTEQPTGHPARDDRNGQLSGFQARRWRDMQGGRLWSNPRAAREHARRPEATPTGLPGKPEIAPASLVMCGHLVHFVSRCGAVGVLCAESSAFTRIPGLLGFGVRGRTRESLTNLTACR